jgi:hypothetical protein
MHHKYVNYVRGDLEASMTLINCAMEEMQKDVKGTLNSTFDKFEVALMARVE